MKRYSDQNLITIKNLKPPGKSGVIFKTKILV